MAYPISSGSVFLEAFVKESTDVPQFIDREAGTCGIFGTQVLPPGDKQVMKIITHFEKAVFSEAENLQKAKL